MNSPDQSLQLALAHHQAGRLPQAEKIYRSILASNPNHAEILHRLGVLCGQSNRLDEADELIGRAISISSNVAEFHANHALVKLMRGDASSAEIAARDALKLSPDFLPALSLLGAALKQMNRHDEAIECCRRMIRINPNLPEAHANLGIALAEQGQTEQAVQSLRRAIALRPNYIEAINALGTLLNELGQVDEAEQLQKQLIQLQPNIPDHYTSLANVQLAAGKLEEAITNYHTALKRGSTDPRAHSNYVLALNYDSTQTPPQMRAAHEQWAARFEKPLARLIQPHANSRDPNRPLRIGYHGLFFQANPPAAFLRQPLLHHDPGQFEIVLYNETSKPDETSKQFAEKANLYRETASMNDEVLAETILHDRIDILIDLFGHTGQHRLTAFARRHAPVQMTYLGYCNTTGMTAMDYLITDELVDPPGYDSRYTEKLIRLPGGFSCFSPPDNLPDPSQKTGEITFGSLHALAKINRQTIALWSSILKRLPQSRLLIIRHTLNGLAAARLRKWFDEENLAENRVEMRGSLPAAGHWHAYHDIDISLDTQPWSGHTTTCESLWMGVPMVTMLGETHAGRMTASVLRQSGHAEWIGQNSNEYVEIAVRLAADRPALKKLRAHLRTEMAQSALCDGKRFTSELEQAYRTAWRQWCRGE